MARPVTRASNANKHPGQVVLDANRVQRPREEVAAEKSRKQAEKTVKAATLKNAHIQIATKEDTMAVEQSARLAGPAQLVRPRPRSVPAARKPVSTLKNAATASSAVSETSDPSQGDIVGSQNDIPKKRHPSLKLTFKDSVNANRKIPNSGVFAASSATHVGKVDDGKISASPSQASSTITLAEGPVNDWSKKVASKSQLKPSAPPSAHSVKGPGNDHDAETFDIDDAPEEFDHRMARPRDGKGVVHVIPSQTNDDAQRGRKRTLSVAKDSDQEDPDANLDDDASSEYKLDEDANWAAVASDVGDIDIGGVQDVDVDVIMMAAGIEPAISQQDNSVVSEAAMRLTTSMSVGVTDNQTTKYIKTEDERVPASRLLNLAKKGRAKNSQLPNDIHQSWHSGYIPALMYWVGNSSWPWTILDEDLSNALYEIHRVLRTNYGVIEFAVDTPGFELACQRIHEWRASFGSIAVTILVAIFTSMGDDYKTQESRTEYAEYQLDGLRFVYEDPDSEEQPGAFLSEFILRIFATHLNAIHGHKSVNRLDPVTPGYQTALALTTAAAEHALVLARDGLILDYEPLDNVKKTHKIALTLNKATNKMSNTGTAFSAANWETETIAYLNLIDQLSPSRVEEIVVRAQPFMKCIRNAGHNSDTEGPAGIMQLLAALHAPFSTLADLNFL